MKRGCVAMAGLVLFLGGCALVGPNAKVDYYQLDYPATKALKASKVNTILGIRRFGIASAYDHDRLVVREKGLKTSSSYYHRWISNPRMMLSDLLLRDLLESSVYRAVVMMPANVMPDFEISGFVQQIVKDDSVAPSRVLVSLDVTLLRSPVAREQSHVMFQKSYVAEIPCPEGTPSGVAKFMSQATREISLKIQNDVLEAVKKEVPEALLALTP